MPEACKSGNDRRLAAPSGFRGPMGRFREQRGVMLSIGASPGITGPFADQRGILQTNGAFRGTTGRFVEQRGVWQNNGAFVDQRGARSDVCCPAARPSVIMPDGMPCAFMILLFATAAAASTVPAQLDAILKDYDRADAPGASVLVALDGKVLYRKAFGLANL